MLRRTRTSFFLEEELLKALQRIKDRDGIPIAEQIRRALHVWVEEKETDFKRGGTRKKS